ncbi:zinc-dependent alcohol dehydrogenase family protein [Ferrovibrio sp.]|jgi:trans-2-enoyl-CoA reductase|uniref:zinc-dependent alcohol dehydrogenase family protein n=1 Tax=Ferrovibrio sp. TaxID=1917215 RepID=UPI0035B05CE8
MIKAIRYSQFGKAHEVAELIELPDPGIPGEGEALIDVEASPINPADLLQFEGKYGAVPPPLPVMAGGEGIGIVRAVGAGVSHLKSGDRVLLLFAGRGNWRSSLIAKTARLFALPAGVDPLQLAMLTVNPPTAMLMLQNFTALKAGDWVIQNAANSGVGHSVIALAKRRGLRSINVVRRTELAAELQALGADSVLVDGPDLPARVKALTGNDALPKLAIDAVAGDATGRLAQSLAEGGVVVNYGMLSGQPCAMPPGDVVFRDISLRGFWLARWFATAGPDEMRNVYGELTRLIADGTIHVAVEATYPLERIRDALAHAAREGRRGKILITPGR